MKVTLLCFTPEPEKTIAFAAKLCYSDSSIEQLDERVSAQPYNKLLKKIIDIGHLSVMEHVAFVFGIEGISRATSHQLVRHRLASYSQQSQRYVSFEKGFDYVIPESVKDAGFHGKFAEEMDAIHTLYKDMVSEGIPPEDARYILPNAAFTRIIVTMNARELLHFFRLRCCERAQWEIKEMAIKMLKLVKIKAPEIFRNAGPGCVKGACTEGIMTCGKPDMIREKFRRLS